MRLQSRRISPVRFELSMVSMIDIVFLLLIFFLVTTSFVRPELRLDSAIGAEQGLATHPAPSDLEPATIDVIPTGNGFAFRIGQIVSADLTEVERVLRTFRNKQQGAIVRAVDGAPFDMPARAVNACDQIGFRPVTYVPLK
jgi:biopolymer transport protein ExbD